MNAALPPMHNTQEQKWSTLASAAQSGDKIAYRQLLGEIAPYIKHVLIGGLANADWADDITQDSLLSIHKALKTYSDDRPFKPWMMSIVNFRRTDFLRKHYKNKDNKKAPLEDYTIPAVYVTNPTHAGEYKDMEDALNDIPEQQRKVFEMIKIQGYTAKEVANEMDMSESAVKVSAHRTMKKLQERLK